jgi:ParB family chromosome partitioning protein
MSKVEQQRKALGRGLNSLLPPRSSGILPVADSPLHHQPSEETGHLTVRIELIDPNPIQPRTVFDPGTLQELAASIRANGVIQPLIVRRKQERFELIAGERRLRAARMAGLAEVPVLVQDWADDRILELQLVENIQREDLNPIEIASAFDRLVREHGLSHEEVGRRTGKDRATVSNFIRLLRLPEPVKILLAEQKISAGHARALLALPDEELMVRVAESAASTGASVRHVEKTVQAMLEARDGVPAEPIIKPSSSGIKPQLDPNIRAAIEEMEHKLGTRVRIVEKSADRGRIEIDYFSQEDLMRIYSLIMGEEL